MSSPLELLSARLDQRQLLDPASRKALLELDFQFQTLPMASFLVRLGERVSTCSIILSGIAYRSKTIDTGERQIVSVHVPGDLLDTQNLLIDESDHDIQMLTEVTLALVSRQRLVDLAFQFPPIGRALWRDSLVEQSIYREWLTNIGRRSSLARIAHLLCEFCFRLAHTQYDTRHGFNLPMSQEQIGDCLGLTSVHVNRMLKRLEAMHLISRNRRSIQVADWCGLKDVGDFTPNYLHLPTPSLALVS